MENKDTSVRNLNKQSPANRQKGEFNEGTILDLGCKDISSICHNFVSGGGGGRGWTGFL